MAAKMHRPMQWDDLRFFHAIVTRGSLAGAARALKVNHSTVYRRLQALEEALATRLFDRLPEGYVLTEAGQEMAQQVERIADRVAALDRAVTGRDVRLTGTLRITTTTTLMEHLLAPHLAAYRRDHPGVQLELVTDNQFLDLSRREADVALRPADRVPEHLVGRRLCGIAWAIYGCRERPETLDLEQAPLVALDEGLAPLLPPARWFLEPARAARVVMRTNEVGNLLPAVRAGIGAAPLPCFMGDAAPELVRLTAPLAELASGFWLLTHPDLRRTARVHRFLDHMAAVIDRHRARMEGAA